MGLVVFAVMGAHIALKSDATPFLAVLFGVMTATFGGLIRDVVAGEVPLALKPEIYVSAALVSSGAFVLLRYFELHIYAAVAISLVLGFLVRAGAIQRGWVLPRYKNRAGRDYS
nr:TRIC cation channel family protein [Sneathiella glossodoripedis]